MIVSTGQKWAWLEKKYVHSYWTYEAKILMSSDQEGDVSDPKSIFKKLTRL